jgi:hypothetical protein
LINIVQVVNKTNLITIPTCGDFKVIHYLSAAGPNKNEPEQRYNFFIIHHTVNGALRDLEAVSMYNGKNSSRFSRIDVLEPMPSAERSRYPVGKLKDQIGLRSCWTSLRFAIADDTGNNKVGLVHDGSKGNTESVTQLSALVNTAGNFGIHMAICMVKEEEDEIS